MGHTHKYQFDFKKKKSGKESQYMVSHPELDSDPPIGSDRESRRDISSTYNAIITHSFPVHFVYTHLSTSTDKTRFSTKHYQISHSIV